MSSRKIFRRNKGRPSLKADNLTANNEPIVYDSGVKPAVSVPEGALKDILGSMRNHITMYVKLKKNIYIISWQTLNNQWQI
jgi:hypothetical protein